MKADDTSILNTGTNSEGLKITECTNIRQIT